MKSDRQSQGKFEKEFDLKKRQKSDAPQNN